MKLIETQRYSALGLDDSAQQKLALLGDLILGAQFNVTSITDPHEIERMHFLDSLSILELDCIKQARSIVDVGSGAGLPALILAIVLDAHVVALESQRKKCGFIESAAAKLHLPNLEVCCARAEDFGRGAGRERYEVAVSRALASLPVVAEYSLPLVGQGGWMVAMKGAISDQELTRAQSAVGILGGDTVEASRLMPFEGAENRWVYMAMKTRATPSQYPRKAGFPAKTPLG